LGNTYHLSIGQGKLGITPLQANLMTNVIANDGKLCEARFRSVPPPRSPSGPPRRSDFASQCQEIGLSKKTIEIIKEGMKEACSEGGTSLRFLDFDFKVACKTGTAEFGSPTDETHAWFTIFVPADDPEISITVLVEAGGGGSEIAAPIAKGILKSYLSLK